jgi:ribosome biogenesis GTPase
MFDLPGGGQLIDTPGLREFGMTGIERHELSHYYPEMRDRLQNCQFNNCRTFTSQVARSKAVENGEIHPERYISYAEYWPRSTINIIEY